MFNLFYIFLFAFSYKFLRNLTNYFKSIILMKRYDLYTYNKSQNKPTDESLARCTADIISLFKQAGFQLTGKYHILDVPDQVLTGFNDIISIFKKNVKDCFSILYWISVLTYLPKNILIYLGFTANGFITKFFQLLYWVFCAIYAVYSSEINKLIQSFISNFLN